MSEKELADLLLYAFDRGITFWDSAAHYGTHRHMRCALRQVPRDRVAIATKLIVSTAKEAEQGVMAALREINTGYIDMCLLHAVHTREELERCRGALEQLLRLKDRGLIRAVGVSCHGVAALEAARDCPDIEAVWCRINYAGLHMDGPRNLRHALAALPAFKKTAKLLPAWCIARLRPGDKPPLTAREHQRITALLQQMHASGKAMVGMKIMGQGRLAADPQTALSYAADCAFLDSFIVGMLSRREIDCNCRTLELHERMAEATPVEMMQ
jgi:aryl-alcohol dehydrogenase-like predicted oxidoreductase